MSREVMHAFLNIEDWYASPGGTFIRMFGREKPLHVLPRYATEKLIMQEVSYHLTIGFLVGLHRKKKAPWPTLPLWIGLYEIQNLKYAYVKIEEFKKFTFNMRSFNPYDPHYIVKDQFMRVQF